MACVQNEKVRYKQRLDPRCYLKANYRSRTEMIFFLIYLKAWLCGPEFVISQFEKSSCWIPKNGKKNMDKSEPLDKCKRSFCTCKKPESKQQQSMSHGNVYRRIQRDFNRHCGKFKNAKIFKKLRSQKEVEIGSRDTHAYSPSKSQFASKSLLSIQMKGLPRCVAYSTTWNQIED